VPVFLSAQLNFVIAHEEFSAVPIVISVRFGLLETIASPRSYVKRLAVRSGGKTVFVDVEDVDWIGAAEN
jgi:hypothetical protein